VVALPCLNARVLLLTASIAVSAHAAGPTMDARAFRPSADPRAQLAYEPLEPFGHLAWSFSGRLHYGYRSVVLQGKSERIVPLAHTLELDPAFALGLGARSMLSLTLPMLVEVGANVPAWVSTRTSVPGASLGDLTIAGKHTLLAPSELGGFALGAITTVSFPTGTRENYASENGATIGARVIADYSFLIAGAQLSAGYTIRSIRTSWPEPPGERATFGNSLPFALALWLKPTLFKLDDAARQRWELALRGTLPMGPAYPFGAGKPGSAENTQLALGVSDRFELGEDRDTYALFGFETALYAGVGVPAFRALVGLGAHAHVHDRDGDGIEDKNDQCADVPEDKDGYQDSDGCPDIDDDEDGVVDRLDWCPKVRGPESERGCPPPDADGDGIPDKIDACPKSVGAGNDDALCNGCPITDHDGDGFEDSVDSCPAVPGPKQGCPENPQ
jgi:OmpA-OmpF porin, OOP family